MSDLSLGELFEKIKIRQVDRDILVNNGVKDKASLKTKWEQVKSKTTDFAGLHDKTVAQVSCVVGFLQQHDRIDLSQFGSFMAEFWSKREKSSIASFERKEEGQDNEFHLPPQGFDPSDDPTEEEEDGLDFITDADGGPEEIEFDEMIFKKGHCYHLKHSEDQPVLVGIRTLEKDLFEPKAYCSLIIPISDTFLGQDEDGISEAYGMEHVQVRSIKGPIQLSELSPSETPKLMPNVVYQTQKQGSKRSFAYYFDNDGSNRIGLRESMRDIELFCGSGGMHLGYKAAGFKTVKAIDKDAFAIKTFRHNNPHVKAAAQEVCVNKFIDEDLVNFETVEVLHASSPCQGFSSANRHAANGGILTESDKKNNELVMSFPKALRENQSLIGVFENVPGIWSKRGMPYLRRMLLELVQMRYQFRTMVLNACDYGDPQSRPRFIIFAAREFCQLPLPPPRTHENPHKTNDPRAPWVTTGNVLEIFSTAPPNLFPNMMVRKKCNITPGDQGTVQLEKDKVASAVRAGGPGIFHYHPDAKGNPQCITVREAAALQSYPNDYRFFGGMTNQYKQVGNSVPCCLAKALAQAAALSLRHIYREELQGKSLHRVLKRNIEEIDLVSDDDSGDDKGEMQVVGEEQDQNKMDTAEV